MYFKCCGGSVQPAGEGSRAPLLARPPGTRCPRSGTAGDTSPRLWRHGTPSRSALGLSGVPRWFQGGFSSCCSYSGAGWDGARRCVSPAPSPAPPPAPPPARGEPVSDRAASHKKRGRPVGDRFWKARKEGKPGSSFQIQLCEPGGWEMKSLCASCGRTRNRGGRISFSVPCRGEKAFCCF